MKIIILVLGLLASAREKTAPVNWKSLFFILLLAPFPVAGREVTQWAVNDGHLILQDVPEIPPILVSRLNQYQNVRSASFIDWAKDGKGIYIRTRFGDISQIHRDHVTSGARRELTWFHEHPGRVIRRENGDEMTTTTVQGGGDRD